MCRKSIVSAHSKINAKHDIHCIMIIIKILENEENAMASPTFGDKKKM